MFDLIYEDDGERDPIQLDREQDGFYHWRDRNGDGHWCLFRAESATHIYLTGNWRNSDGNEGVSIFVWPKSEGMTQPEKEKARTRRAATLVHRVDHKVGGRQR